MILIFILFICCQVNAQVPVSTSRCLTDELYSKQVENSEVYEKTRKIEVSIQNWIKKNKGKTRGIITIPIVVHVVWNNLSENICEEQILSQIEVLNQDFNRKNTNLEIIPPEYTSIIANVEIEFCLAQKDPEGYSTTGITRTRTDIDYIGERSAIFYSDQGGMDAWDTSKYLNIWLGNTHKELLGYASIPGASEAAEDGVVINPNYFGTTGTAIHSSPYHLGRVTTHEIGHYLNLFHPWGYGAGNCEGDDLVEDTPQQENSYIGCPAHPQFSCESMDILVNFMDYVDDECMAMFTKGQKLRMIATLDTYRKGLIEDNSNCNSNVVTDESNFIEISPNPASHYLNVRIGLEQSDSESTISLFDLRGRLVRTWSKPKNNFTICLSEFANGIYFLVFSTNDISTSKRLVILN